MRCISARSCAGGSWSKHNYSADELFASGPCVAIHCMPPRWKGCVHVESIHIFAPVGTDWSVSALRPPALMSSTWPVTCWHLRSSWVPSSSLTSAMSAKAILNCILHGNNRFNAVIRLIGHGVAWSLGIWHRWQGSHSRSGIRVPPSSQI